MINRRFEWDGFLIHLYLGQRVKPYEISMVGLSSGFSRSHLEISVGVF